jgi:hypothetical protein
MAISVKTFINPLNCDEPAYEVPVLYHPSSAGEICDGNGTNTNIYGDYANLADIATNGGTGNAANSDICQDGMDVVFVVDYTGSMQPAITGVKNGISNIVSEIQSQSNGNYRLGLVLFDGTNTQLQNRYVGQSDFYADLDSTQKINTGTNVITCVEKMNGIGNQSTFTTHLNYLAQADGPTGMSLGQSVECGGVASYEVIQNSFAGQWRANVLKLIILITDDEPEENSTYFNNTLIPAANTNNVQVFSNLAEFTAGQSSSPVNTLLYSSLSNNTTPAGQAYTGLDFSNNTWVNDMISGITTLCAETTTYTCDPAPAGWYTGAPLAAGATIHYWDGSAWVASHDCQYTVTVDLIDNISNGSVDDILLTHPNQLDLDTFTFTGAPGSTHTATIGCTADSGYTNLSVNVSNVSDTNVVTNTSVNPSTDEVTITVTIPNQNEAESIQINGSASQIQRTVRVDVINNTNDNTNVVGGGQTPVGQVAIEEETPASWVDVSSIYSEDAKRYTFSGTSGSTTPLTVGFLANPSDYSINVTNVTVSYFELDGSTSSAATSLGQTAIANLSLNGSAPFEYSGNLEFPSGDVWVKVFVNADVNQPLYRYTLYASDSITGASVDPTQLIFNGYTGATFQFQFLANADSGYNNVVVNSANLNLTYPDNSAITTGPTVNNGNTGATGTVTMPAGGGQGGIILGGTANAIIYSYVITIDDSTFSGLANWLTPVTLSGVAGSSPSVVVNSQNMNSNYSYNLTGISNNSGGTLTSSISNATSMAILLDLDGGMPIGGGSATVTLTGSATALIYEYELDIVASSPVLGQWAINPIVVSGPANQVTTGSFNFNEVAGNTYSATGVTSNDSGNSSGTLGTGLADLFDVDYSVTIPAGGGNGTLTVTGATSTPTQYSYTVIYDGSNLSGGNNHTATPASQVLTGAANTVQAFQIDLDPSPSYYVITISGVNNITTHDGANGAAPELAITGYNSTTNVIDAELTMPSGGGTGYIKPKGDATSPTVNFTVTASEVISNATLNAPNVITFSGIAGSGPYTGTYTVTPSTGWNVNIASALVGSSYSGALTSSVNNTALGDETVDITLSTMPVGGGNSTLSINGNSSQQSFPANMIWDEGGNIAGAGAWDNSNNNFTGVAGDQFTIDNTWRIQNNTSFYSASGVGVVVSGTNYPTTNPFSGLATQSPTSGTDSRTQGTFTMPVGGGTWYFTISGRTQTTTTTTTKPAFTCKVDFDGLFGVNPGSVGDTIQFTWDNQAAPQGLNMLITPSTYQLGSPLYRADFTVVGNYSNAGQGFSCEFRTTGTTTTTTKPNFKCADAQLYINAGAVGDNVIVLSHSKSNGITFSIGQSSPTVYQNGTTTYFVDIAISPNATQYANAGGSIVCEVSGTGTTTTLPLFECSDTNIQIPDGAVGANVLVNMNGVGSAQSVSPATYQLGQQSYTVNVNVPAGYSNSGGKIPCDVSGTGTTTTTTTADPCLVCNDTLFLDVDEYTKGNGAGVANGVLVAWKGGSDTCTYGSSNVQLYYSSTLNGTYINQGSPKLYNYNETKSPPTEQTQIGGDNAPSYILGVGAGLYDGYYYITATESASGCTITSPTVHMAEENTTAESSNKYMYLWGVDCSGDASESTNWFTASTTVRGHVLMVNPGTTLSTGNPNIANQYSFTNNSGAVNMLDGDGFNYSRSNGTVKQYWGCTDNNVLRIKVDLNTSAGLAAFNSIGTGTAYQYTGTSLSFNSELDGKIKFCGIAIPPRQYSIFGASNGIWNYNNGKAFRFPGTLHMSNSSTPVLGAVSAPHSGTSEQNKEGNHTANPASTSQNWAICHGLIADCGFLEEPIDPKGNGATPSPGEGEELDEEQGFNAG